MPWVDLDENGHVVGVFACEQPSMPELVFVEGEVSLWVDPKIALAAHRYDVEVAGVEYLGKVIQTDRETRANWLGILFSAQLNPAYTVKWKTVDGSFVDYNAQESQGAAFAVSAYVQRCFTAEAETLAALAAGDISTEAEAVAFFDARMA